MLKTIRLISLSLLFVLSILSIVYSIETREGGREFSFFNSAQVDFSVSQVRIESGLKNIAHLKGFFVMSLLALIGFKYKKIRHTCIFVGVLTAVTEGLQSMAPTRHARLTDGLPNLIGMLLAVITYFIFSFLVSTILEKRETKS